jgi:ABC-type phosphate transport system auxiliary subunit
MMIGHGVTKKETVVIESEIKIKLDELANLRAAHDALTLQKQTLIDTILTDEIKAQLTDIDAEFVEKHQAVSDKVNPLEAEIRRAVITNGVTIKGTFLQAVWVKACVNWDVKALNNYAAAHPEILPFRKEGSPSCTLRSI